MNMLLRGWGGCGVCLRAVQGVYNSLQVGQPSSLVSGFLLFFGSFEVESSNAAEQTV